MARYGQHPFADWVGSGKNLRNTLYDTQGRITRMGHKTNIALAQDDDRTQVADAIIDLKQHVQERFLDKDIASRFKGSAIAAAFFKGAHDYE